MRLTADRRAHHYAEAHFPGLYSIVLNRDAGCLDRVFIAKPGELHLHLMDGSGPFLWHRHGYDLTEVVLAGIVWNTVIEPTVLASGHNFYAYHLDAGIDTGRTPKIHHAGVVRMKVTKHRMYERSRGFFLKRDAVHRVVFKPCPATGWFACRLTEYDKGEKPTVVYSRAFLQEVPNADKLYRQISTDEAQDVLDRFTAANRHLFGTPA